MQTALFLAILVLTGTAGDLCITRAMKWIGSPADLRPVTIANVLARALTQQWMWAGILLHALAFFAFLALLSWTNVSVVVPASALSYVVGAVGAKLFLREHVSAPRWAGVFLIGFGVALVLAG